MNSAFQKLKSRITPGLILATLGLGSLANIASATETSAEAKPEVKSEEKGPKVAGIIQMLGSLEILKNRGWSDNQRTTLFLKEARLDISGTHKNTDYKLKLMFGGEEVPNGTNSVFSLLDAYVNVPLRKDIFEVKVGQFLMPYGRERLTDDAIMSNTRRSIQNNFFNLGRDVGLAVHTKVNDYTAAVGVFTGAGLDQPERYLPERFGVPMLVGRIGINKGLDKDVFTPFEKTDLENDDINYAVYLNGMYTTDSRVGHSTALNLKKYDVSLMINPAWNPYLKADTFTTATKEKAIFYQFGADAAVEVPLSTEMAVRLSAEANYSGFKNRIGSLRASGGVVGGSLILKDWEFGLKHAIVNPDTQMAYTTAATSTSAAKSYQVVYQQISETTGDIVYNAREFGLKFVGDISMQHNVPMGIETGHGMYNLMLQPDQITQLASGGVETQTVYLARLVMQYEF